MGDSLRQVLIDRNLISETFTASDGYLAVGIHSQEEGADIALAVFADWLDRRAKSLIVGESSNDEPSLTYTATSLRFVRAAALEKVRDEIRQEIRDAT